MAPRADGAYAVLACRPFTAYLASRTFSVIGGQMILTAVGWQVAERTGSPLALGLVGLAQVAPVLALAPWAGRLADRADRRGVMIAMQAVHAVCGLAFALTVLFPELPLPFLYAVLVASGTANGIQSPSGQAILPNLVPGPLLARAVAWRLVSFEISSIAGPILAGFLIAWSGLAAVYAVSAVLFVAGAAALAGIARQVPAESAGTGSDRDLLAGFRYVWRRPVLKGALALDMFAVLFGGATALLPIFARDILDAGPEGLGFLRAALPAGSLVMSMMLLHLPPMTRAGRALFWCVAGYGACMIAFGLSTAFFLSLGCLAAAGMFDAVSVVIRHTIVQAATPDAMRGQVSAVNGVFIMASNQLGEFESGVAAALVGVAPSVVVGGGLTLAVVGACAWLVPELRRLGRLDTLAA